MKTKITSFCILLFCLVSTSRAQIIRTVFSNTPGTNADWQYIEIAGAPNQSLSGIYLIQIEGDNGGGSNPGVIDDAMNLGSYTLGSNGLLLIRNQAQNPAPSVETNVQNIPSNTTFEEIETGTITFALVTGWSGTEGSTDIDSDNNGTPNASLPWTTVLNAVSIRDDVGDATDRQYAAAFGGINLPDVNPAGPTDYTYDGIVFYGGQYYAFELAGGEANPGPYTIGVAWNSSGTIQTGATGIAGNDLTQGRTDGALPATLVSFHAFAVNKKIQLNWITSSESNTDLFEVQRSYNGVNFETVGTVKAAGNSQTTKTYNFADGSYKSNTIYYRLKTVDIDKSSRFSQVSKVKINSSGISINNLYPSPARSSVNVEWNSVNQGNAKLMISSLSGHQLLSHTVNASKGYNMSVIDVRRLMPGQYILTLQMNDVVLTEKFIKQ